MQLSMLLTAAMSAYACFLRMVLLPPLSSAAACHSWATAEHRRSFHGRNQQRAVGCEPHGFALGISAVVGGNLHDHLMRWLAVSNRHAYIQRHGYSLYVQVQHLYAQRPPAWGKLLLAEVVLRHSCAEYVWMLDSDAYIMNLASSIESVLQDVLSQTPQSRPDVVANKDCNGLNSGSIFFRNTPWTHQHLADAWTLIKVRCLLQDNAYTAHVLKTANSVLTTAS
jgi:hypothetical protein